MEKIYLFIDDKNHGKGYFRGIKKNYKLVKIDNYYNFVNYINNNEIPYIISMKLDLGDLQYSGNNCMMYLREYCDTFKVTIPFIIYHDTGDQGINTMNNIIYD